MDTYLILGEFNREGLEAMVEDPKGLTNDLKTLEGDGVSVKNHWATVGRGVDVALVIEAPSNAKAAAFTAALGAKCRLRTNTLTAFGPRDMAKVLASAKTRIRAKG